MSLRVWSVALENATEQSKQSSTFNLMLVKVLYPIHWNESLPWADFTSTSETGPRFFGPLPLRAHCRKVRFFNHLGRLLNATFKQDVPFGPHIHQCS